MEKSRRPADFLTIDPSSTFMTATSSRNFEELPENFLETASPQQGGLHQMGTHEGQTSINSPQLAPLAPMSISSDQGPSYQPMLAQYIPLKDEGIAIRHGSPLDKTNFGNGPAGLLSPLHVDGARRVAPPANFNRSNSGIYIKEEVDTLEGSPPHHLLMPHNQQDLDRNDATPPAVSNVELASTMITTILGDQTVKQDSEEMGLEATRLNGESGEVPTSSYQRYSAPSSSRPPAKRIYSTNDANDPLNAEIDDDIYIDTKDLCKRIAYELKQHSIPQAIFAERILCRSQGTLSDLLRNPKPWNKLKSGRETFRRMFNWVQQPLAMRLGILDMYNKDGASDKTTGVVNGAVIAASTGLSPPTPAQNVRHHRRSSTGEDGQPVNKRPRLVFTDIQKRTLQAIFKETQRPSREMQQTIAEHLRLDLSTVANFFMNARRRSRLQNEDEPAPFQQIRSLSPPNGSSSPTRSVPPSRMKKPGANPAHIDHTLNSVCEDALAYSRRRNEEAAHIQDDYKDDVAIKEEEVELGPEDLLDDPLPDRDESSTTVSRGTSRDRGGTPPESNGGGDV